ncbi:MAG: RnfH family protein, partial [Candidatus Arsenophonus melophagi]|nr:RnfH family protein [Candidatus Arsenophonus melophagi]
MADITVEVVFALPDQQFILSVQLVEGASVEMAILQSGILSLCNDINLSKHKVGIFSLPAKLSDIVSDGDRVEIYRPLLFDPKEIRRRRAE